MSQKTIRRLLKSDGTIQVSHEPNSESENVSIATLNSDFDLQTLGTVDLSVGCIKVNFLTSADGRGFSIPRIIREQLQYRGLFHVSGGINPDQLSLAFQSGYDGVQVSEADWCRYTEDAWLDSLSPVVSLSYAVTESVGVRSIWELRKTAT